MQKYPVVATDVLLEVGTAVFSLDEHLSQTNTSCFPKFYYQSVYYCLIRYLFARIRIAKCFMNSSKRFRCEVMFENEHTFCSSIHRVCICTDFAQLAWSAAYQQGWPWLECHGGGWESLLHWGGPASGLIILLFYVIVVELRFNGTLCTSWLQITSNIKVERLVLCIVFGQSWVQISPGGKISPPPRQPEPALGDTASYPMDNRGSLPPEIKRPKHGTDRTPHLNAEDKNAWSCVSTFTYDCMKRCFKHRNKLTLR
jgi:hypothetical protein